MTRYGERWSHRSDALEYLEESWSNRVHVFLTLSVPSVIIEILYSLLRNVVAESSFLVQEQDETNQYHLLLSSLPL